MSIVSPSGDGDCHIFRAMSDAFADWRARRQREEKERKANKRVKRKKPPPPPPKDSESFARVAWVKRVLRREATLDSPEIGELEVGARVRICDRQTLPCGTVRVQIEKLDPGATSLKAAKLMPHGWSSLHKDGVCTLLQMTAKAASGVSPSAEVAQWLSSLDTSRRAVETAMYLSLSSDQFRVLRMRGTEPANSGKYTDQFVAGTYACAGCSKLLYSSEHKFHSACGWASFCDNVPAALERVPGRILGGMPDTKKVEILCSACGGCTGS